MAQALFVVLAILVTIAFRPRAATWEALRTTVLNEAVNEYEGGGQQALHQYLDELDSTQHVRAYLFDENGNELSRRPAPDWAMRVAAGGPRSPHDGFLFPAPPVQRDSRASSDGKHRYTVVLGLPPGPRVFIGPRGVPITGLIIGVITSGLVCYLLSWYLTKPIVRLRTATRQLEALVLAAQSRRDPSAGLGRGDHAEVLVLHGWANRSARLLQCLRAARGDGRHEVLPRGANGIELFLQVIRAALAVGELVEERRVARLAAAEDHERRVGGHERPREIRVEIVGF